MTKITAIKNACLSFLSHSKLEEYRALTIGLTNLMRADRDIIIYQPGAWLSNLRNRACLALPVDPHSLPANSLDETQQAFIRDMALRGFSSYFTELLETLILRGYGILIVDSDGPELPSDFMHEKRTS